MELILNLKFVLNLEIKMKTFNKIGAQGDIAFIKISALPEGLIPISLDDGKLIVAHSETGHHHAFDCAVLDNPPVRGFKSDNPMKLWLDVQVETVLEHYKTFDKHESVLFTPGFYEIRRQREHTPEGFRRVQD